MSVSIVRSLPSPAPPPDPIPLSWVEQLQDALAMALLDYSNIETLIYLGEGGLALRREQAEAKVNGLRAQLSAERTGVRS